MYLYNETSLRGGTTKRHCEPAKQSINCLFEIPEFTLNEHTPSPSPEGELLTLTQDCFVILPRKDSRVVKLLVIVKYEAIRGVRGVFCIILLRLQMYLSVSTYAACYVSTTLLLCNFATRLLKKSPDNFLITATIF